MKEKVLALLQRELPEIDFTTDTRLATDGILDSLSITTIIAALTMEFGIEISVEDITEENFDSVEALAQMVERLMER